MTEPGSPDLELTIGGELLRFPAVWLRDNCPCPDCVPPGSTQKVNDITGIPNGVAITRTDHLAGSVAMTFGPDQHRIRPGDQLRPPVRRPGSGASTLAVLKR